MLIASPRHTACDLERWRSWERYDARLAASDILADSERRAMDEIERFIDGGPCYCGVSWGKDSVVTAHLVIRIRPTTPLAWIRVEPIFNPDCPAVRDAFLAIFDVSYNEIVRHCRIDSEGVHASGTLESGFAEAARCAGSSRHISGVRGEESGTRKLRMMRFGISTERTCAPIGWWKSEMVFAYLHKHRLPVHPVYAMSMGGVIERGRLRVSSLFGERGKGRGRAEWENLYYRDVLARVGR